MPTFLSLFLFVGPELSLPRSAFSPVKPVAMLSSALLSSRFGGATRVERDLVPAAGRQAAMLRQRRRRQQQHSSSTSTSTPAIWDRWGSNKKTGESNPASVDASTETEALLLESVGEKWRPREGGRRRKKRDKTAGENGRPKKKKKR